MLENNWGGGEILQCKLSGKGDRKKGEKMEVIIGKTLASRAHSPEVGRRKSREEGGRDKENMRPAFQRRKNFASRRH